MSTKSLVAVLATGIVAMNATVSHADNGVTGCHYVGVAKETVTGGQDTFTGVAVGYAVNTGSIRCFIEVNGGEAATTPVGPTLGGVVAVTAGQLTYVAGDTDVVRLCAVGGPCSPVKPIPTQDHAVMGAVLDMICPVFATVGRALGGGVPGLVEIGWDGSADLLGMAIWGCGDPWFVGANVVYG